MKARNAIAKMQTAPNYDLLVRHGDTFYEGVEIEIDESLHLVVIKIVGEKE